MMPCPLPRIVALAMVALVYAGSVMAEESPAAHPLSALMGPDGGLSNPSNWVNAETHQSALPKTLEGYQLDTRGSWLIVSELDADTTRRWGDIIATADTALRKTYFSRAENAPTWICLFRDGASYRRHAAELWGQTAPSPYG